jgi:hypothetical protein
VGKIGKDRVFLGASAPKVLGKIIDERREPLGWSRAKFTLEVLELWRAQGCPHVSESDRLMQIAKKGKK